MVIFSFNIIIFYLLTFVLEIYSEIFVKLKKINSSNYFAIFNTGLYIYNYDFTQKMLLYEFNESQIIKNDEDKKTAIISDITENNNIYIICLVKKYAYIFNNINNELNLYYLSLLSGNYDQKGVIYNLMPYDIKNNNIYFILSFIYEKTALNQIIFLKYTINLKDNKINVNEINYKGKSFILLSDISHFELSCQIDHDFPKKVNCFYSRNYQKVFNYVNSRIDTTDIKKDNDIDIKTKNKNITKIKSSISNSNDLFTCFIDNNINTYCFINNTRNKFQEIKCLSLKNYRDIEILYLNETDEFALIYKKNNIFIIIRFNIEQRDNIVANICEQILNKTMQYEIKDCDFINFYSLIYHNSTKNYILINDCNFKSIPNENYINISIFENSSIYDNYSFIDEINFDNSSDNNKYSTIEYFQNIFKMNINNTKLSGDGILGNIRNEIKEGNLNDLIKNYIEEKKQDLFYKYNNIMYQITNTFNQIYNQYNNMSTINLGECENELRAIYNIDNNLSLILLKVEYFEEGLKIPIIEYEVYHPITNEKLNLTICKDKKIEISIPVDIEEKDLFLYDPASDFYNDVCFAYTTKSKTDILLKDRRYEFNSNNMSLCQKNCEFTGYDSINKRALCDCQVNTNFPLIEDIKLDKDKLYKKFTDLKETTNIHLLKCYKELFNINILKNNIGNYFIGIIILYHLVNIIIFLINGDEEVKNKITQIIKNIKINVSNDDGVKNIKNIKINVSNDDGVKKIKKKTKKKLKKKKKICLNDNIVKNSISKDKFNLTPNLIDNNIKQNNNNIIETIYDDKIYNIISANQKYNDYEMNILPYNIALNIDKRTYIDYYFSLIRTKHLIVFTFYTNNDYNLKKIKICLLLFSFALTFTVNSLFFNESLVHKIYKDKGSFDFIYQLPQILYSFIIISTIISIVKYLSLSEKDILKLKNESQIIEDKSLKILNCIIKKIIFYFIISLLLLLFFWYFLSCFCVVYKNTQIFLIKDTSITIAISLISPFFIYLIPGIFRIPSLRTPKKDKQYLYIICKIIQFI